MKKTPIKVSEFVAHSDAIKLSGDAELEKLQRDTFDYFLHETNPANGLVIDKTEPGWPASIAATGLALACYPVSVERGFMSRAAAIGFVFITAPSSVQFMVPTCCSRTPSVKL